MEILKLTTEASLLLNERVLKDGNVEYHISTSTYKKNGERVLIQMAVDAFEDGEWEHELSSIYELGDIIEAKHDDWLRLI